MAASTAVTQRQPPIRRAIGGVTNDLPAKFPDVLADRFQKIRAVLDDCDKLLTRNRIFVDRTKDCIRRRGENISSWEVETVLAFTLEELREGFAMRRLVRRGVPIRTPTYVVGEHLIWGATARILGELLKRLDRLEAAGSGA